MKVNELMVGDWVNVNGLNLKVGAIHADEIGVVDPDYKIYWCSDDEFDRIDPIPLTEEILLKNGFDKDERSRYYHEYILELELWDFDISWTNAGGFKYEDIRLAYVHQLQHLLRLCGIEKEIEL